MIYLIDEKKNRQQNYLWTAEKIQKYRDFLMPIYSKIELDKIKEKMLSEKGVILFHDSFFDDPMNKHEKEVDEIRQSLNNLSKNTPIVFFSGAISSRTIDNNYASLPVSILYSNLEYFINKYIISQGNVDLKYLAFGLNYRMEEIALVRNKIWSLLYSFRSSDLLQITISLEEELEKLLLIINQRKLLTSLMNETTTINYFKYQITSLIKNYIYYD